MNSQAVYAYRVWDVPSRLCHWINAIAVAVLLPCGQGHRRAVAVYLRALAVTLLLVLLLQAATGLVLAGSDIFYAPFGHCIASWIAAPGVAPGDLLPYRAEGVDAAAQAEMRALRAPVIATHEWGFYLLATLIVLHVVAVVITEVREGGTLITAMVTGRKLLTEPAKDDVDPRQ
jgi:cytochrome b